MVLTLRHVTKTSDAAASCRVQRVALPGGEATWTVLGADHCPVGPAEQYLEFLRAQRASPNTVKSYARGLALWWQYLGVFDLPWEPDWRLAAVGAVVGVLAALLAGLFATRRVLDAPPSVTLRELQN